MKRKIVEIDESKCNGCGVCIPNCREGAMQIIDGKAKLISDKYCDGLGACLGHCPQDAIHIVEREAQVFDEKAVEEHLHEEGHKTAKACPTVHSGCPSVRAMQLTKNLQDKKKNADEAGNVSAVDSVSELTNWPIQLSLAPVEAPFLKNADLLIAADCVAFSLPDFHRQLLKDKVLIIACPKLDNGEFYVEKLTALISANNLKSLTIAHMEVPCCFGLESIVEDAIKKSGKDLKVKKIVISIDGKIK